MHHLPPGLALFLAAVQDLDGQPEEKEGHHPACGPQRLTVERILHEGVALDGAEYGVQQIVEEASEKQDDQGWQAAQQFQHLETNQQRRGVG